MRQHRASDTAEGVCLFRACEATRSADRRIIHDPYAAGFLSGRGRAGLTALRGLGPGSDLLDRALSGVGTYALARHACIDAWLVEALDAGSVAQVVLLGAGYDSRAWRLAGALGERVLFEVDHPATGGRKAELVAAGGLPPSGRQAVAVDLARSPFAPPLAAAGWRPELPTAWIWEGVSMYLSPAEVQGTLAAIHAASAPGSELFMDFWGMPVGWSPRAALTRVVAGSFAALGEPVRGSFPRASGQAAVRASGLAVVEILDAAALETRCVPDGRRVLPDAWLLRARRAPGRTDN